MLSKTITSEQMAALLASLGYQLYPSKGPQRVFENRKFDAIQLLPPADREPYARIEHLMTLRRISVEKGIVDEQKFDELFEKARHEHTEQAV